MSSGPDAGLLVDNSVYTRLGHPTVAAVWREALARDELVACGPFVGEALYSARNVAELEQLLEELTVGMRYVELDDGTWRLAYEAQRRMAAVAPQFHRRPLGDYLVAAAAHQHRLGVLHYDRDFDLLVAHGGLRFESRWAAEPGTLTDRGTDALRPLRRAITARLAQFSGSEAARIYADVVDLLDEALETGGKPPLPAPDDS